MDAWTTKQMETYAGKEVDEGLRYWHELIQKVWNRKRATRMSRELMILAVALDDHFGLPEKITPPDPPMKPAMPEAPQKRRPGRPRKETQLAAHGSSA